MSILTNDILYPRNELGMINICLKTIGEAPLPNDTLLENIKKGTDAFVAKTIVNETMIEVQSRGWFFNTEKDYELIPDSKGFITLPLNVLRVDQNTGDTSVIIKNGRLYDRNTKSFIFTDKVILDIIFLVDYEELPINAYQYIAYRAARKFQEVVVGSDTLGRFAIQNEMDAYINLNREHLQYNDYNMIETRITNRRNNPIGV